MDYSMNIGAPTKTSSPYTVSHCRQPVRVGLIRWIADILIGKYSGYMEVRFSANDTVRILAIVHLLQIIILTKVEALRSSLRELEGLLKEYSPLMSGLTEKVVGNVIKYGCALAEVGRPTST